LYDLVINSYFSMDGYPEETVQTALNLVLLFSINID